MGGLSESVKRATLQKLGLKSWKRKMDLTNRMWAEIEQVIDGLDLAYGKVRLYQDGLPVCGREKEIVADLAKAESRNHRLLFRLMEKGAILMGTESSELLVEEYQLIKQLMAAKDPQEAAKIEARQKAFSESILKRRDQFIADRINSTLCSGETGILFLGMLHSPGDRLHRDIRVIYPINRPSNRGR